MKNRILSIVLAICMVVGMLPVIALATEMDSVDGKDPDSGIVLLGAGAETTVEGEMSGTDFLAKAVGGVITLTGDVALTSTAAVGSNLTINLAGHTLTTKEGLSPSVSTLNVTAGTLTINGTGTVTKANVENISGYNTQGKTIYMSDNANLTVQNGAVIKGYDGINTKYGGVAISSYSKGTITVSNATIRGGNCIKKGITSENYESYYYKYQGESGAAIEAYSSALKLSNATIQGGCGLATEGTQTSYISGGSNFADGGEGIVMGTSATSRDVKPSAEIIDSDITGGNSDLYNAACALKASGTVNITRTNLKGGSCYNMTGSYGIAGAAIYQSGEVSVTVKDSSVAGGGDSTGSWIGCGFELSSSSKATIYVEDSSVFGGNASNIAKGYGNAFYAPRSWNGPLPHDITLKNVTLSVCDKAYGDGSVFYNYGDAFPITLIGDISVTSGTLKDVDISESEEGLFTVKGDIDPDTVTVPEGYRVSATEINIPVAEVGEHRYATLADAVNAAKDGDTVKLLTDVELDKQLEIADRDITLNLFGKKITYVGSEQIRSGLILVHNGASLTVDCRKDNGSAISGGYIDSGKELLGNGEPKVYAAIALTGEGDDPAKSAKLTLAYGTIQGYYCGVAASDSGKNTEITVNAGKITNYATDGAAIYIPHGSLTVKAGTITGSTGIYMKDVALSVAGSTITGNGDKAEFKHEESGFHSTGDALAIEVCNCAEGAPTLQISGGTFKSTNNKAVAYYEEDGCQKEIEKFITGGSYSSDPGEFVAAGYLSQKTSDTTYTVSAEDAFVAEVVGGLKYTSLRSAFSAVPKNGETPTTIRLLKSTDIPIGIFGKIDVTDKNVVLDLNGNDISSKDTYIFTVAGSKLHITGKGTISINCNSSSAVMPIWAKGSSTDVSDYTVITIDEGVTLKSNDIGIFVYQDRGGTYNNYGLVVNVKGTIDAASVGITVNGSNKATSGNVMQFNLDGANLKNSIVGIYAAGYAEWNLKDCTIKAKASAVEIRAGEMTIDGGEYTATAGSFSISPNGSGTTASGAAIAVSQHGTNLPTSVYVNDGIFTGVKALHEEDVQDALVGDIHVGISGGYFNGEVYSENCAKFITGGYFTDNPNDYKGDGYYVVGSDKPEYLFMITDQEPVTTPVVVSESVDAAINAGSVSGEDRKVISDIIDKAEVTGITEALKNESRTEILTDAGLTKDETSDASIIEIEIAAKVTAISANISDGDKPAYLAFDVKPVATVKVDGQTVKTEDGTADKEVAVSNSYLNGSEIEVRLPIPEGLDVKEIKHICADGSVEYFFKEGGSKQFTVENGVAIVKITKFSTLILNGTVTSAAMVNGESYETLQEAIDAAPDGAVIVLQPGIDLNETVVVGGKNLTIDLADTGYNPENIGTDRFVTKTTHGRMVFLKYNPNIIYTRFLIGVAPSKNGVVKSSYVSAFFGMTVTLTVTPNFGYELDTLTVTDPIGNIINLTEVDGKYTFKMPCSNVKISATFKVASVKPGPDPEPTPEPEPETDPVKDCAKDATCPVAVFTDVPMNDWKHDGIHYCVANRLMNGIGANTFAPDMGTKRAMLVTLLYRLEGEPEVGESTFTDVPAGEWYTDAVIWAAENKIVEGFGGKFEPTETITREAFATILYRYAKFKGYDVSVGEDTNILSYTDAEEISSWAIEAMQWAVGTGLIEGNGASLNPRSELTRAEMAAILYRLCENVVK